MASLLFPSVQVKEESDRSSVFVPPSVQVFVKQEGDDTSPALRSSIKGTPTLRCPSPGTSMHVPNTAP